MDPVIRWEEIGNTECFRKDDMLFVNLFSAAKGCFPFIMLLTAMYASLSGLMIRKRRSTNSKLNYTWSHGQTYRSTKKCGMPKKKIVCAFTLKENINAPVRIHIK